MKFLVFLDNAATLEETIAACYSELSDRAPDPELAGKFKKLFQEELNHARVIKTGKNYVVKMPEIFGEATMDIAELLSGLEKSRSILTEIQEGRISFKEAVSRLSVLELVFE